MRKRTIRRVVLAVLVVLVACGDSQIEAPEEPRPRAISPIAFEDPGESMLLVEPKGHEHESWRPLYVLNGERVTDEEMWATIRDRHISELEIEVIRNRSEVAKFLRSDEVRRPAVMKITIRPAASDSTGGPR